jgi:hypothetical protein
VPRLSRGCRAKAVPGLSLPRTGLSTASTASTASSTPKATGPGLPPLGGGVRAGPAAALADGDALLGAPPALGNEKVRAEKLSVGARKAAW